MNLIQSTGWLLAASDAPANHHALNFSGWLVMLVSVGSVLALISYCLYRVLTLPPIEQEHLKGPLDIDTKDTLDAD
ncbi:MAG: hypothetical protein JW829_03445 [Pirellulales bacterium]|nr:hypothetical protein [Pirellulales bacterium]